MYGSRQRALFGEDTTCVQQEGDIEAPAGASHTVIGEHDGAEGDCAVIREQVGVIEDLSLLARSIASVEGVLVLQA